MTPTSPFLDRTTKRRTAQTAGQPAAAVATTGQRLEALSGLAFAGLLVVGFFLSGSDAPDYAAAEEDWTSWATDNAWNSRLGAFLTMLAGSVFLHFAGTVRSALEKAEAATGAQARLAPVASAGALAGITGITTAVVMMAGATSAGSAADPLVTRAVATATVGPFLVAAMGFAALLSAAGLVTLRRGVFGRWVGVVALLGGLAFLITLVTLLAGPDRDSVYGYGYFVGILALAVWSAASSFAGYRRTRIAAQG